MQEEKSTRQKNKRIAKNTIYLYIRMIFVVCINLYTARLVLQYLGVKDFGVYNIVGGIVSLMMFVNSTMRGATSRFISYSIGTNDKISIANTISSAILVHAIIAFILLILGETFGLWFVNTQLNLPYEGMTAVNWLYQFSLLTSIVTILQVPLNACIISYERMGVFAVIEIVNVILKFIIVFSLVWFHERLIAYGGLLLCISIVVFLMYLLYCKIKIETFIINKTLHHEVLKPMLLFALYDLFGNGTFAVRQQGINILINRFFGVTLNAASAVATQVSSTISTFINNILSAFKPQIVKEYSIRNIGRMQKLMQAECEIMLLLATCIFVPLIVNIEFIMRLWLKEVPSYAVIFCKILLCSNMLSIVYSVFCDGIHATGKMKKFSFLAGTLNLLSLLGTYFFFINHFDAEYAYISICVCVFFQIFGSAYILNKLVKNLRVFLILLSAVKPLIITAVAYVLTLYTACRIDNEMLRLFLSIVISCLVVAIFVFLLSRQYRKMVISYLSKLF